MEELVKNKDKATIEIKFRDGVILHLSTYHLVSQFSFFEGYVTDNGVVDIELPFDSRMFLDVYLFLSRIKEELNYGDKAIVQYYISLFEMCDYLSLDIASKGFKSIVEKMINDLSATLPYPAKMSSRLRPDIIKQVMVKFYIGGRLRTRAYLKSKTNEGRDYEMVKLLLKHIESGEFEHFPVFDLWTLFCIYTGNGKVTEFLEKRAIESAMNTDNIIFDDQGIASVRLNSHIKPWNKEGEEAALKMKNLKFI